MKHAKIEIEKQTLDAELAGILTKVDYDRFMDEMPGLLKISSKTWYNYRFGKTRIPHGTRVLIESILREAGYELNTEPVLAKI